MATIQRKSIISKDKLQKLQAKVVGLDAELSFINAINEKKLLNHKVSKPLEMISYQSDGENGTEMLALPGTIRIFIGNSTSSLLKKLKKVVSSGNATEQAETMKAIAEVVAKRKLTDRITAQKIILESENLFEFKCGTKTLLDGGILPYGDEITYLDIAYCGTPTPNKFPSIPPIILDEFCGTGPKPRPKFDGLVVVHEPRLVKAEIDALKQIPTSSREMLIGGGTVAIGTSVWYVSAVAAVAVVVMTVTAGCAKPGLLRDIRLDERTINKLGPQRTASQLIALREKAMLGGI